MPLTQGASFVMGSESAPLSFSAFVLGLASTTLIHLGEATHPEGDAVAVDLEAARQSIDVLDLLKLKTRGNLTPEEEQLFTSVLADLKVRFVQRSGERARTP
jgi:Domain of unknown function (DUF1844)